MIELPVELTSGITRDFINFQIFAFAVGTFLNKVRIRELQGEPLDDMGNEILDLLVQGRWIHHVIHDHRNGLFLFLQEMDREAGQWIRQALIARRILAQCFTEKFRDIDV